MNLAPLRLRELWLAIGWGLVAVLLILCLIPHPPHIFHFHGADKVEHILAWALLMGWFMQIYAGTRARIAIGLGLVAFGVGVEFLQLLTATRRFEFGDMVADGFGVFAAWALARPPLTEILYYIEKLLFSVS